MKNLTKEDAERARELFDELQERFNELRQLITSTLDHHDRDQFKYNCLGNCEAGLFEEHDWLTKYSGIKSLESWVMDMEAAVEEEGNDEDDEEPKSPEQQAAEEDDDEELNK